MTTGPLEALLAELEYNVVVVGGALDEGFPRLASTQFERALATNAFLPLESGLRLRLLETYKQVQHTNQLLEKQTYSTPEGQRGAAQSRATDSVLRDRREWLRKELPLAIDELEKALGRTSSAT